MSHASPQPCLTHMQDRLLPASSLHGPPRLNSPWTPHCSELSCCVGYTCHSGSQQRDAGVANHMMPSETTSPLAHALVYGVPVGAHSNELPPEYAGRLVQLLRRMFWCVISMVSPSARTRDA